MKEFELSLLLTVLMSMVGTKAFAYDFAVANSNGVTIYYNWINNYSELQVTYRGNHVERYSGVVVIPATITYNSNLYPVTSIGDYAFDSCSGLTSVTIPNSVTSIGEYAFKGCSGLTSMTIPNSVTSIVWGAFSGCSGLTSIVIPNSVTSIGEAAFEDCSGLTSITVASGNTIYDSRNNCNAIIETASNTLITGCKNTIIPNSVTSIGYSAFCGCSGLTSIVIPNSVTFINTEVFTGCSGLTSMTVASGNTVYDSRDNCNAIIETASNKLLYGCKETVIPNSVMSIESAAFSGCSGLTSIVIPNSVTFIGSYVFQGCSGLTSMTVASGNTNYDSRDNCNAIIITATNKLLCGCKETIIPNSVTSIDGGAFSGSGLTSMVIPNSVTNIDSHAFDGCSGLTSMTVASGNTKYDSRDNCNAIIETASNKLFIGCKSTIIPNSVTSIGGGAFRFCSGLTSIEIPNSVTSIGNYAFEGCSSLTSVTVRMETPLSIGKYTFSGFNYQSATLYVPAGSKGAYSAANYWRGFGNIQELPVSITMATGSGSPRTVKGYSSKCSLDFTNVTDVKAYIAIGYSANSKNVLLANVNIVPAYTGVVLRTNNAGVTVNVPTTTNDFYYANLLKPAVENVTIQPTETIDGVDYTNLMVGTDSSTGQLGFITFSSAVTRSNNCYLQVPTTFVLSTAAARQSNGFGLEFVDSESTDIQSLIHTGTITDGVCYDLQGRKMTTAKKGLYIRNGKKVFVK